MAEEPKVYADPEDFDVPQGTLDDATEEDIERALVRASRLADSYLSPARFTLPLKTWGEDLRMHVAGIATWLILKKVGFSPDSEDAKSIRQGYDDALDWLNDVQKSVATPVGVTDSGLTDDNQTVGPDPTPQALLLTNRLGPIETQADDFWDKQGAVLTASGTGKPRPRGW